MKRMAVLTIEADTYEQIEYFINNFNIEMSKTHKPLVKLHLESGRLLL